MIYQFITDDELDLGMKKYFREQITELTAKLHIQTVCEGAAFSMIKSKLNNRFDITKLFPSIKEWDSTKAYVLDEYACKNNVVYKAKQAGLNQDPEAAASAYWVKEDPRDMLLVKHCACMTAYFMLESVNPRKISEDMFNDYTATMEWLDDVRDGKESPSWPVLETGGSDNIPHGSNEPNEYYY